MEANHYIKFGRGSWLVSHVRTFADAESFADAKMSFMPSIHDLKARREYLKEVWRQCQPKEKERYGKVNEQFEGEKTQPTTEKKQSKPGKKVKPQEKRE